MQDKGPNHLDAKCLHYDTAAQQCIWHMLYLGNHQIMTQVIAQTWTKLGVYLSALFGSNGCHAVLPRVAVGRRGWGLRLPVRAMVSFGLMVWSSVQRLINGFHIPVCAGEHRHPLAVIARMLSSLGLCSGCSRACAVSSTHASPHIA